MKRPTCVLMSVASFFVLSFSFALNFNGCYINPTIHLPSSMLEVSDYPNLARVIRVQPLPNEKPATGFSWGDYEDVGEHDADGEDDGWGVVTNKRSSMLYISHTSPIRHVPITDIHLNFINRTQLAFDLFLPTPRSQQRSAKSA